MIKVTENFTGYPDGKRREFVVSQEPSDLSPDYEALLVGKGHAVAATPAPALVPTEAPVDRSPSTSSNHKNQRNS